MSSMTFKSLWFSASRSSGQNSQLAHFGFLNDLMFCPTNLSLKDIPTLWSDIRNVLRYTPAFNKLFNLNWVDGMIDDRIYYVSYKYCCISVQFALSILKELHLHRYFITQYDEHFFHISLKGFFFLICCIRLHLLLFGLLGHQIFQANMLTQKLLILTCHLITLPELLLRIYLKIDSVVKYLFACLWNYPFILENLEKLLIFTFKQVSDDFFFRSYQIQRPWPKSQTVL